MKKIHQKKSVGNSSAPASGGPGRDLIPPSSIPRIQRYWPLFQDAGKKFKTDPTLSLAVALIESDLDAQAMSAAGARGMMQIMPATAADIAQRLGVPQYDLFDAATSIDFGTYYLSEQLRRFEVPRLAIAAYHVGPTAVSRAGPEVPADVAVQRYVQHIMVTWQALLAGLGALLGQPAEEAGKAGRWRLICPPDNWQQPVEMAARDIPLLATIAERMQLRFRIDESSHKVYLGTPVAPPAPPGKGRLLCPIPGATKASNGAWAGDTGLDILCPYGSPVVAAASGWIVYSEWGHTPWQTPPDTPHSILIELDEPFVYGKQSFYYLWLTHLSRLRFHVPDGSGRGPHVRQGELLGYSGTGNRVNHIHVGVIADRAQTIYMQPFQLAACFGWLNGGGSR